MLIRKATLQVAFHVESRNLLRTLRLQKKTVLEKKRRALRMAVEKPTSSMFVGP
jgi:hypothetical protein